jgi:hypothetical protein
MGAIELHTAGTVQAHQRLALTSLLVTNAKAVCLNVCLGEMDVWDSRRRAFIALHHCLSPSSYILWA